MTATELEVPDRCNACGRTKGERREKCPRCEGATTLERMIPELPVSLLTIDAGVASGVCFRTANATRAHVARVDLFTLSPDVVCREAILRGVDAIVLEHPGAGMQHVDAVLGIGGAIWIWRRAWRLAGGQVSREVMVYQTTWRAGILRRGAGKGTTRKQWKEISIEAAREADEGRSSAFGENAPARWNAESADAYNLDRYARRSLEVFDAMPPTLLAARGRVGIR